MRRKLVVMAAVVVLVVAALAGCPTYETYNTYYLDMDAIAGSIYVGTSAGVVWGETAYHVLLYKPPASVDPMVASTVNDLVTVAKLDGVFPGTPGDSYLTATYTITDVPAGDYFMFVWVDADASGTFDRDYDLFGFYEAMSTFNFVWEEPFSPNIVVEETGLLDIDVWVGTLVS